MTRHETIQAAADGVSRRGFIKGSAGLTFALTAAPFLAGKGAEAVAASGRSAVNAWVTIGVDDSITIYAPSAEMGQGVMTSLPMIVAEELDADWSKVKVEFSPNDHKIYGNPAFGGFLVTVGSRAVDGYWDKLRMAGAQARRVLLDAVAEKWGVPASELTTEPSVVVHKGSGRRLSYGNIAKFAAPPQEAPKITTADLKKPSEYRILGKDIPRVDVPSKVNGTARYGMDVQVPGMLYAAIARAPQNGSGPDKVDDAAAREVKGVVDIVKLPYGVGVVADTVDAARAGKLALDVTWTKGKTDGFNSEKAVPEYHAHARDLGKKGVVFHEMGDVAGANAGAAKVVRREYFADYTYHAQMEPMNATAWVRGEEVEVWAGTQAQSGTIMTAAKAAGVTPNKVTLHQHLLGGGFGRRVQTDYVTDAVLLSKAVGKPVKVIWTREDDLNWGKLRPQTAHYLEAGVDAEGNIVGWRHRVAGESVLADTSPARLKKAKGKDQLTMHGSVPDYAVPNQLVEHLYEKRGARMAAWRAIGAGYNKFAIEAFVDELARELGKDPIDLRISMLQHDPRALKVIDEVMKMSDYRRKRNGTGLGLAYADIWGTRTAGVAEISLDEDRGQIKVHNFWSAVDPGTALQPQNIVAQTESCVIYGLGQCLKERITIAEGAVEQTNFHDYQVMRMSEVPAIHTKILQSGDSPTGIGEIALPLTGGAVANAFAALTGGKRIGHMPFTPERVKAALNA